MERIKHQEIPNEIFENMMKIENSIHNSSLEMQLLELIRLRVAQINKCAYCVDMHVKELKHTGETELRIVSLSVWDETPYFTEKEKTVLLFAEKLTKISEEKITDDDYNSLLKYFDKTEICYLTLAVAQINTWTRLVRTFNFTPGNYKVTK